MLKDVKVIVYTSSYRIEGTIKLRVSPERPRTRLSDVLRAAASRGEEDFLLLANPTVISLKNGEPVEGGLRVLGINKSAIEFVVPARPDLLSDQAFELDLGPA